MDALERCTGLTNLNGYDEFQGVLKGGLSEFRDGRHELALAVGRFLPRSASTLTSLDLGRVSCCVSLLLSSFVSLHVGNQAYWSRFHGRSSKLGPEGGQAIAPILADLTALASISLS